MDDEHDYKADIKRYRAKLSEILRLNPASFTGDDLVALQADVRAFLEGIDGRVRAGFSRPDVQGIATQRARDRRSAFLAAHGPTLRRLRSEGLSYAQIAARLNEDGVPAPRGGAWAKGSVEAQLKALEAEQG